MNRREFLAATAGLAVIGQLPNIEVVKAAALPSLECPHPYTTDGKQPILIHDLTTGNYHGHRCYAQNYFYESEMPPKANRVELETMLDEQSEYNEWFNRVNPPDRPCWAWEDRDHKFDFERFKTLLGIDKPFVFFPWLRNSEGKLKMNIVFAGYSQRRFEYTTTTVNDQAWQVYGSGLPCRLWLYGERYDVVQGLSMTSWSNPGYPVTQWTKHVEKHL